MDHPNRMLHGQFIPLCGDCGPEHVFQNCPLKNPPTLKQGPVAPVNLMKVTPNQNRSSCGHSQASDTSSACEEEVYVVTQAQKDQVIILGSPSMKLMSSSHREHANVGKYPNLVVEQAKLVAI